jgi:hypothetical protein
VTQDRDATGNGDPELVNPYHQEHRRRAMDRLAWSSALRRRVLLVIVLLISLALVAGTVATSCGAPVVPMRGVPAR